MSDAMFLSLAVLSTALLFGGMTLYSFGFAAFLSMSRRNSPNAIPDLGELTHLPDFVFDKRQGQRASAKKHRRNRHYERQFIRNTLAHLPQVDQVVADEPDLAWPLGRPCRQEDGS